MIDHSMSFEITSASAVQNPAPVIEKEKPKAKIGGVRPGAGRTPLYGKARKQVSIRLSPEAEDFLRDLGNGNMSAGVMKAATIVMQMESIRLLRSSSINKQD